LLRCKPRRIALEPVGLALDIGDLSGCEDALDKTRPEPFDGRLDPRHFGYVHTGADNHLEDITLVILNSRSRPGREDLHVEGAQICAIGKCLELTTCLRPDVYDALPNASFEPPRFAREPIH